MRLVRGIDMMFFAGDVRKKDITRMQKFPKIKLAVEVRQFTTLPCFARNRGSV